MRFNRNVEYNFGQFSTLHRATVARICFGLSVFTFLSYAVRADNAAFDLAGPSIQVHVERGGKTLPISQIPNLMEGDRLYVHPELPDDQATRYLLIVTFLRGSTNPPPEQWFTRAELWNKKYRDEGIFIVVPEGAQQAVIFLAPATAGDFSTLRSAVRGRPGSFVRAVQDLDQASLDRSRLDTYLSAVHKVAEEDPAKVHDTSMLLARSLNIHLEEDCFKKPTDEQAACLTQRSGDLVLNDGHSQSVVGTLTAGPTSDLIGQLTYTPQAGSGYFSPYVGAIVDMGRILDSLHTAQYQYIPALSLARNDRLQLKLNNPPSFHNPKSVIVVGLPAIQKAQPPQLHPINPDLAVCSQDVPLVLQLFGAPLTFSTDLLHGLELHIAGKAGSKQVPLIADPAKGGFVVDSTALNGVNLGDDYKGTIEGRWGFDSYVGPSFELIGGEAAQWTIPATDTANFVAGSGHVLHLDSPQASCVQHVSLRDVSGNELKSSWKLLKSNQVEVTIPPDSLKAGGQLVLGIKQAGLPKEQTVALRSYDKPGDLKVFRIIPGDSQGILHGTNLGQVATLEARGNLFKPDLLNTASLNSAAAEELTLVAAGPIKTPLQPNEKITAQVTLSDGRKITVPVEVQMPRPDVRLLSKAVQLGSMSQASVIQLANQSEVPLDAELSFAIKAQHAATFSRDEKIEIATSDRSFTTTLSTADGRLTLQDPYTVVAKFSPAKSFGSSAFGPLQFRALDASGIAGDWQTLAKLIREPLLQSLECPADNAQPCTLKGSNLFLLDSVAGDQQFTNPVAVPEGFLESSLTVPHPVNGTLFVKLRDDPSDINRANLSIKSTPTNGGSPHYF